MLQEALATETPEPLVVSSASLTTFARGGQTLSFIARGAKTVLQPQLPLDLLQALLVRLERRVQSALRVQLVTQDSIYLLAVQANAGELNYTKANGFNINRTTLDNLNIANFISGITTNDKALVISSGGTAFASVDLLTRTLGAVNQIYGTTADAGTFVAGDTVFLTYSKAGLTGSIGNLGATGAVGATGATGAGITSASLTALAGGGQRCPLLLKMKMVSLPQSRQDLLPVSQEHRSHGGNGICWSHWCYWSKCRVPLPTKNSNIVQYSSKWIS